MMPTKRMKPGLVPQPSRGFTLVELLVVMLIILIVSAATLPAILSGLRQRQVGEAARIFHAALGGARDAAILNNAPRGIRLLPDPVLTQPPVGTYVTDPVTNAQTYTGGAITWACNRFVPIEPASDYREGRVTFYPPSLGWANDTAYSRYSATTSYGPNVLIVLQSFFDPVSPITGTQSPVELTSWAWNLRVGDRIQFEAAGTLDPSTNTLKSQSTGSGHVYTVVGPVVTPNPERFINYGDAGPLLPANLPAPLTPLSPPEFLFLVNGVDDDGDGIVDNGYDGVTSPPPFEAEQWLGAQVQDVSNTSILRYVVKRRPIPSKGARETLFPGNVVIDLTTWNRGSWDLNAVNVSKDVNLPERSRLPIDGISRYIDVFIEPSGQIIQTTSYSSPASYISPFLHFWLTDREGVVAPIIDPKTNTPSVPSASTALRSVAVNAATNRNIYLPMPDGTTSYPSTGPFLQGERMLITISTKTGNLTFNSLQNFDATTPDSSAPFYAAQRGVKESP